MIRIIVLGEMLAQGVTTGELCASAQLYPWEGLR